jgi:response regulator NasT
MAIGVLMHRYSLVRAQAQERLQGLARIDSRSLEQQARIVLEAVELLAAPPAR